MKIAVRICGTLLAIALVPTAVARADAADDAFLKAVADHGITGDPEQLIATGHAVCDRAENDYWWNPTAPLDAVMASLHLSIPQGETVVNDAASAYCPWDLALGL